ncbi:hypothetical protein [Dongshaea marina]|uniref:hypothetical protein n=1 Tax=Dongshaea marina TaxID=2047966 RepID=UPI000D3E3EE1|nr:hypothetical protein [Dongshaea marina]
MSGLLPDPDPTRITEEARQAEQKICQRFRHYLIGQKHQLAADELDDGLALNEIEDQEQVEQEQQESEERILLDVEKARVAREEAQKQQREKEVKAASNLIHHKLNELIIHSFHDHHRLLRSTLRLDTSALDLLALIAEPFPRLSVLASVVEVNQEIRRRILYLVANQRFMKQLGHSPRQSNSLQTAMGLIGIEVLKLIIPAMLFKYRIRMYSSNTPQMGPKLWRYLLTTGQSVSFLLKEGVTDVPVKDSCWAPCR